MESKNLTPTVFKNIAVIDITDEGYGLGKSECGLVLFIEKAVPGDVVDVTIRKKKKNCAYAKIDQIQITSPHRANPFCTHFYVCGGCKWQHIAYNEQLRLKQKYVCDALERIGHIDASICKPILPSKNEKFYRNKLEFTFSQKSWIPDLSVIEPNQLSNPALGFHVPGRFDKILNIDECYLQSEPSNEIRNTIRQFAVTHNYTFYDVKNHTGELRNLIIRTTSIGEIMVAVVFAHTIQSKIDQLMEFIKTRFSMIHSLLYIVNQKKNDTLFDQKVELYSGRDHIFESMPRFCSSADPLKFKICLKSFYQTNSYQAHELYKRVAQFADLKGHEIVYDLYTGTGTIALFLAHQAKRVIGVEYIETAIADARHNAETNDITNATFYVGDMKDILNTKFVDDNGKPDVIIVDPPRAGMHDNVVQCLLDIAAQKIIYVSCNPSTQARDLLILKEHYHVECIQPVDMFPHTQHVENVVLLLKK